MGIFDFLKRNKKVIQLDFDISTEPVYVYPSKKIKLPTSAVISKDTEMFFCDSGKILDSFKEGEYEINISSLPNCDKRFKLSKPDADGRLAKYFYCNVYFVNKQIFKYKKWKTYRKANCYDKRVGEFNVGLSGGYAFQIKDAKTFITMMLKEYDIIKNKEAESILSGYVGEFVLSFIEKKKLMLEELLDTNNLVDEIYQELNQKLDFLGVEFLGFNIEKVNLPKHLKLIKQNILQEQEIGKNIFEKSKQIKEKYHSKIYPEENKNNVMVGNSNNKASNGNKKELIEEKPLQLKQNNQNQLDLLHFDKQKKDQNVAKTQQKNVDTLQKKDYDGYRTNVRCLFCGFENKQGDERCALCGQTLKRKGRLL